MEGEERMSKQVRKERDKNNVKWKKKKKMRRAERKTGDKEKYNERRRKR